MFPRTVLSTVATAAVIVGFASVAPAATITWTPDTLAEFDTGGTVILTSLNNDGTGTGPGGASTFSDPTTETPNKLRITNSTPSKGFATFTHDVIGAAFDPSALGAINSIDFAIDVNDPNVSGTSDTPIYFGFTQGGNVYFYTANTGSTATAFEFRNSGSTSFAAFDKNGLVASVFGKYPGAIVNEVDQTVNPDFSASGGELQFVFGTFNGSSSGGTRNTDFKNAEIVVDYTPIPEPASLALLGLGGLMMLPRRKNRA